VKTPWPSTRTLSSMTRRPFMALRLTMTR
jgi:hypothetical protein